MQQTVKQPILRYGLLFAVIVGISVLFIWYSQTNKLPQPDYPITRTIQYSFTVQNTSNQLINNAELFVYAPVKQTATQTTLSIQSSHDYLLMTDHLGNQVLKYTFPILAPFEMRIVRIRAELGMSENSNKLAAEDLQEFLNAEPFIEVDHPELITVAEQLAKDNVSATVKSIYAWVANSIDYQGYVKDDLGALYALQNKQGDCTEYMYLTTALNRINGIPARGVGGYVYSENATLKPKDYHNWSEVYINDRWYVVDAQKKYFQDKQSNFIAMRIITDESRALLGNSHRFAYSGESIKVTMN